MTPKAATLLAVQLYILLIILSFHYLPLYFQMFSQQHWTQSRAYCSTGGRALSLQGANPSKDSVYRGSQAAAHVSQSVLPSVCETLCRSLEFLVDLKWKTSLISNTERKVFHLVPLKCNCQLICRAINCVTHFH